jgi:hypothetical protein
MEGWLMADDRAQGDPIAIASALVMIALEELKLHERDVCMGRLVDALADDLAAVSAQQTCPTCGAMGGNPSLWSNNVVLP